MLDLSTGNRLIDAREGRTSIALPGVDPVRLAASIASGSTFAFESTLDSPSGSPAPACFDTGKLRAPLPPAELARRLTSLRRAARAQLADGGVHTLWLALGLLHWSDADGVSHAAPLWLQPVELERSAVVSAGGGLRLVIADTVEPRFNATLGEKLRRDFDIVLDARGRSIGSLAALATEDHADSRGLDRGLAAAADDTSDLAALLETAEAIAISRAGWRVERGVQLGIFSFAKFVMWNDLDTRADALLASPVVAHLAAGGGVAFAQPTAAAAAAVIVQPEVQPGLQPGLQHAAPAVLDRRLPELVNYADLVAPLDADASQLLAVAAAGAGASFVLQGPPGTGKSQTIANLIVHAVSRGKSVLFVTDKIAALEVVQQRLAAVGLGDFCLELHSHKAGRAPVLHQLGRVIERAFRPGTGPAGDDARLAELRAALDGHVAALHRVGPFGRSLHDVLGRLVELRTTPRAALAERDATGLDGASLERRRIAVEQLAHAAIAVEPVSAHPWQQSTLERWPLDGRERALAALDEAAAAAAALGGGARDVAGLVPGVVARTREQLQALGALTALAAASPRPGAELLTALRGARGDEVGEQIALIRARGTGTIEVPRDPLTFLLLANRHRMLAIEVGDRFMHPGDPADHGAAGERLADLDAHALWTQLRKWSASGFFGAGPVRYMALRGARAEVRAVAIAGPLESDAVMITALEAVIAERACRKALLAAAEPAKRWFGDLFAGDLLALDLLRIEQAVSWAADLRKAFDGVAVVGGDAGRIGAWRSLVAQVAAVPGAEGTSIDASTPACFGRLAECVARWQPALVRLAETTGIEVAALGAGDDHLGLLREQIETLRHAIDALRDWVAFHGARRTALANGVGPAVTAIERGDLAATEIAAAWERATLLAWADAELSETPALARFHGAAHHAHVAAFGDLDRATLALVRSRAMVRLAERVPRVSGDPGGELGTLMHELKKQRGHRPLRALFAEIPTLLPRLAPCMLMSPLAVAQYLDPAVSRFDIVVFDEASQLPTADAIGALARGHAAVIVGDSKQLPPTRFFETQPTDADDVVADLESVLDDCVAARLPELRLAWHYRSRHEDLFAFANQHSYGDRLQVFPAAQASPDLGIAWRKINGVYDRGGTRQNRAEAEAVVAEVVARLRDPAQRARSIAVVTFSRAQQELVEDLLDEARAAEPALEPHFEHDPTKATMEPVIVKNLEAMQGDERDVVLLSVGYGPDATGTLAMNFGPLSQRGGERRLNVAITRAREQLVVFSSFDPADITDDAPAPVRELAALLAFAKAGGGAARAVEDTAPASRITAAIARALVERGWIVRHQVGCGAYKVDLAVVDPNDPAHYVLAIEHDGSAYASAPVARDRDRLRAQILAQLGWRLHRIWSLDWWADPEREIQRAHGAIVAALAASRQRRAPLPVAKAKLGRGSAGIAAPASIMPPGSASITASMTASASATMSASGSATISASGATPVLRIPPKHAAPEPIAFDTTTGATPALTASTDTLPALAAGSSPIRLARGAIPIGPYTVAAIPAGRRAPDDLFAPRYLPELGKVVEQVLAAEAPMHVELLARRVGGYFGIGRVTPRVTDQVRIALAGRGRWGDEEHMVWRMDQDPAGVPAVRVAGNGPAARRDIDEVPLSELAAAARIVVERAVGIGPTELIRDAARLLGFSRITDRILERVAVGVQLAQQRTLIVVDNDRAKLPE